jgi:cytochrome c553
MRGAARPAAIAATVAFLCLAAPAASAQGNYAQRFAALCATCHGANGRGELPNVPVLAGQHSFYAITQLFLFREGRRANQDMAQVAKSMTDQDMRGFSEYIATLPPVPAPPPAAPPDAARMARGQALAQQFKCVICHGADFSGGQQVPRLAQQREEYLRMTLHEFSSGKRPGYTMAMLQALNGVAPEDLDTLAYYIARFSGAKTSGK